ncbi:MAG: hypothetical protein EXR28_12575 [Betaproteobacteria bacterium]|nr:hypothetical protein [Betaproteobacteria bacterium]
MSLPEVLESNAAPGISEPERDLAEREARIAAATAALDELVKKTTAGLEAGTMVEAVPMESMQKLIAAAVRLYAIQFHAGRDIPIFGHGHGVTATDTMVVTTAMLKAVNIQLFELGMWQMWARK